MATDMSAVREIEKLQIDRGWRGFAWIIVVLMTSLGIWAYFAELDEVAIAEGEVAPEGQVKTIQHLEGGIIQELLALEGDRVAKGDPLLRIELAMSGINENELSAKHDGLILTRTRLQAEIAHQSLSLPNKQAKRQPLLAAAEIQAFMARRDELTARMAALAEMLKQRKLAIQELLAARTALRKDLALSRENFAISTNLMRDNLVSKLEHLERKREVQRLEGELAALAPAIPRSKAALAEAGQRSAEEKLRAQRETMEQLARVKNDIARTEEVLIEANSQTARTTIYSPTDGVVKGLKYHTIGGVVRPGDPIMEIVPTDGRLVIEARLNPIDRGYVSLGQKAVSKISAYDFIRYGGIDGTISHIGADTVVGQDGIAYFKVLVKPEKNYLGSTAGELPISSGMIATVDIHTGRKSVMEYLMKPLIRVHREAFRER
ncbi:MAG: HlyD family type I secretion periplasmic adaptor subunit [Rhodospirillaceae bacterium]|jgi:membrane fusion protein, adhesin transport system|nr:HlyD family type I secretion periplasmic adaptor subunit [Rhodospirillaceae bacterium]MBT5524614.1 HlyD family type I secretion periplasmic adaptor subunit [Rhodospirillaceae bacterium]MBT6589572.1 HlyD family type I secretion periplasmic adaptor subunit [Rhodospirillaceae bacterium]